MAVFLLRRVKKKTETGLKLMKNDYNLFYNLCRVDPLNMISQFTIYLLMSRANEIESETYDLTRLYNFINFFHFPFSYFTYYSQISIHSESRTKNW